jgi:DNA-binding response OmpR family regulator
MSRERFDTPKPVENIPPAAFLGKPQLLVFHINDNTDDQVLFQAACKKANVPIQWHVAESATRGISYLQSLLTLSKTQSVRWPDLVILDIVMPGESGLKVLEFIRANAELRLMPVVIFTGMPTAVQVDEAYRLGANSFLEKPHEFSEMVKLVGSLYATWSTCMRPSM